MQQDTLNGIVEDYFLEPCDIFTFFKFHHTFLEALDEILFRYYM